jgi:hypothetical protein
MKGTSGWPAKLLRMVECPPGNRVAGRSRIKACLYEAGRLQFGDVIVGGVRATIRVSGGLMT